MVGQHGHAFLASLYGMVQLLLKCVPIWPHCMGWIALQAGEGTTLNSNGPSIQMMPRMHAHAAAHPSEGSPTHPTPGNIMCVVLPYLTEQR